MIQTTDFDVVVIGISVMQHLKSRGLQELWIAYGTRPSFGYIPAHQAAYLMGDARALGLLTFHSLTGCDIVSAFHGKGKKTAWQLWKQFPEVPWAFHRLAGAPLEAPMIPEDTMRVLEQYVARLYHLDTAGVDAARFEGFCDKGLDFDRLPQAAMHYGCTSSVGCIREVMSGANAYFVTLICLTPLNGSGNDRKDYGFHCEFNVAFCHMLHLNLLPACVQRLASLPASVVSEVYPAHHCACAVACVMASHVTRLQLHYV